MRLILCLLVVFCPYASAAFQWDNVERVVAVGDVHGAYPRLVQLLQAGGLIDEDLAWSGGATHLVSMGDLLDRGPQSRKAMDLFMRLQPEALASGGHVHVLLGNHELMNLTGDLRDTSSAEHAALVDLGGHRAAFASDGHYGSWLVTLPFVIRINSTVFAHGGFSSIVAPLGIDGINKAASESLQTLLRDGYRLQELGVIALQADLMSAAFQLDEEQQSLLGADFVNATQSPLFSDIGPLWYRGNAACHPLLETPRLEQTLATLGADRAVVGHTPTPDREINKRLNDLVYIIDTGMLKEVYGGQARALDIRKDAIRGESIRAFGSAGDAPIISHPTADPLATLGQADYVTQAGDDNIGIVTFPGSKTIGRFVKLSRRGAKRAVAAYALDRLLGLDMVPATLQREIDGQRGVIMAWSKTMLSERGRQDRALTRPNYCERDSDFDLLGAFDALQDKRDRSLDNLLYDQRTWEIRVTENDRAFSTNSRLPRYVSARTLPPPMARALAGLNTETLAPLLGDLLRAREIKALLKRRDAILAWSANP